MNNVVKFPKKKKITYTDKTDVTGLKRRHDRDFGNGSWEELEKGVFERHPEFAPGGACYREENPPRKKWFGLFLFLLIVLPTFCQANGDSPRFPPGFIVDAADERNTLRTPPLNRGNSIPDSFESREFQATSRERVQIAVSGVHQPQYVFNTPADVSEREFMASVRKLDKSKEHYVGR